MTDTLGSKRRSSEKARLKSLAEDFKKNYGLDLPEQIPKKKGKRSRKWKDWYA